MSGPLRQATSLRLCSQGPIKGAHPVGVPGTLFGLQAEVSLFSMVQAGNELLLGGVWSDGETIWVADTDDDKLYAYRLAGGNRAADKDFDTLVAADNNNPAGIWSDGETMWVADSVDDKLYAYQLSDKSRKPWRDIDSLGEAGNSDPAGLWSDGRTIWVADSADDRLYAYGLEDGSRRSARDFATLKAAGNLDPAGLWSDGVTMWIADHQDDKIYAYRMWNGARDSDKDINTFGAVAHNPRALWSDGEKMWVLDASRRTAFAYNLTTTGELDLASITFNRTAVSGVTGSQRSYTLSGTVPLTADVTIAATASDTNATVDFSYPDIFSATTGHQIALDEGANAIQIFVVGQATFRTYVLNVTAGDAPAGSTTKARIQVDEDGGGTLQFRGTIAELTDGRDIDWVNVTLEADQLYAIILKGRNFGDTDRTLDVPYLGGLLMMGVYQDDTDAIGAFVTIGIDGRAQTLFKPATAGDYHVVVAGALAEYVGRYDLRVRPYEDDHFPNSIESESEITFPSDSTASDSFPSASATGKLDYAFDHDWFKASDLVGGDEYAIEARHGRRYLLIKIYDTEGNRLESRYDPGAERLRAPGRRGLLHPRLLSQPLQSRSLHALSAHAAPQRRSLRRLGALRVDRRHHGSGRLTRANARNSWTYRWYRRGLESSVDERIRGANASTYTLTEDDAKQRIRAEICYLDDRAIAVGECRSTARSWPVEPLVTVPHDWSGIPSGLTGGDRFRLLFVSKDTRNATSGSIHAYNAFIRGQVQNGHTSIRSYLNHFAVLGSTRSVSARDNAAINFDGDYQGLPIYWLVGETVGGQKVADDYADLCDGSWDHRNPGMLSDGSERTFVRADLIATGTLRNCNGSPNWHLGASTVAVGNLERGSGSELVRPTNGRANLNRRMYGLSYVFEVGETPSSSQQQANSPASGLVEIAGRLVVGETLVVNSAIADADGTSGVVYAYQWFADGSEIAGATASTYTLTGAERGRRITVAISFTDYAGNEESLTSDPTAAVELGVNTPATGAPQIANPVLVNSVLRADTSGIADADGLSSATYGYQWLTSGQDGDTEIAGATRSEYRVSSQQAGMSFKVRVSFTDDGGHDDSLTSPAAHPSRRPTGLSAAVSGARVVLNWSEPSVFPLLFDYQVLRETPELGDAEPVAIDTRSRATSYADTDVESGVLYRYRVKAANFWNQLSPASDPVEIRMSDPTTPDTVSSTDRPTGLIAQVAADGRIALSWTAPTAFPRLFEYRILRERLDPPQGEPELTIATDSAATYYNDGQIDAGALYRYRVKARNYLREDSPASDAVEIRAPGGTAPEPTSPPDAPTTLTAEVTEDGEVVLSWTAPAGSTVSGYQILRRRPREGEGTLLVYVENTGDAATAWTDTETPVGTLYVYRVKAINSAGVGPQSNYVNVDHLP